MPGDDGNGIDLAYWGTVSRVWHLAFGPKVFEINVKFWHRRASIR
jgi:hypothetical protein